MVHPAILMNATPTTIHATRMQFVQILLDHTTATVLLDILEMEYHAKVRYIRDDITGIK